MVVVKKKKYIYSNENLEGLLKEIIIFLWKYELYDGVSIYTMNKRYSFYDLSNDLPKILFDNKIPIYLENNIDVKEFIEYSNPKTLTLVMEGELNEYLYYRDVYDERNIYSKITKIFEKYGFYMEIGSCYAVYAEENN